MSTEIIPVFSGGVGRSGTTIVAQILRKHPNLIAGKPNEIRFLTESYGLLDLVFGMQRLPKSQLTTEESRALWNPMNRTISFRYRMFRKKMASHWWKRINRIGEVSGVHRAMAWSQMNQLLDRLGSELSDPVSAGRNFLFGYVRSQRRYSEQRYWMDTTPPNAMQADVIYRLFPEAKFIEMRRFPLDNLASVLKEPWGPNDLESALPWFRDRISLAERAKSQIKPEQHLTLWLEDLVERNRESSYSSLLEVVGLSDYEPMRSYFNEKVKAEEAHFGRWRNGFTDPDTVRSQFERIVGPL